VEISMRTLFPPAAVRPALAFLFLITSASPTLATDSGVEWSVGTPQTMALGLGSGDATFTRAASCAQLSATGTAVHYDTVVVTNTGRRTGMLDVRTRPHGGALAATCSSGRDTVLAVYSGTSFNPANATAGCIAHNDNEDGGTLCSRVSGISVRPGASVTVVVAGVDNDERFPYDLRFDGSQYGGDGIYIASFEANESYVGKQLPATGEFTVDTYPAPLAAGSRLDGGVDTDGSIRARLALAPAQLQDIATGLGLITLRIQMWQNGAGSGQIAGNNTAVYGANDLFLRLQHATVNGSPVDLGGNCQFGPITWSLAGNADAQSIDLTQASYTIPPGAPTACNGLGSQLNAIVAGTDNSVTLGLER
jgi:hypothetical protein